MGSLKDEMRGLREEHQPCEKTDDGVCTSSSDGSSAPGGPEKYRSHESTPQEGDYLPDLHVNASTVEETDKDPASKDQELTGGNCGNTEQSDCKDGTQTSDMPEGEETTAAEAHEATISIQFVSDGDESKDHCKEKDADVGNVVVPVPSTPTPSDLRSPAPYGQQHMHTQVSLEVVQCCSAATSPMTPPEGGHSFFFPSSFGKTGAIGTDTTDGELQVGQKEFCSVATSPIPMTPKTPSTTAFPELSGREAEEKEEKVKKNEAQRESGQQESISTTESSAEAESEITAALKFTTSKELKEGFNSNVSPETKTNCVSSGLTDSQVTLEDDSQQCKQPRMGSMDQDITILVTHYANNDEEEDIEAELFSSQQGMVKIEEKEEEGESSRQDKKETDAPDDVQNISDTNHPQTKIEEPPVPGNQHPQTCWKSEKPEVNKNKDGCEEIRDVSVTKPSIPESPAPFGCHNMRTQVSLEVVQCQSAATSPMTPPEGDQAFCFPSTLGKGTETKEMQVGQQVEFRSVATAPMTPRTPITTTFPEVKKEPSVEVKIVEEDEDTKEKMEEDEDTKEKVEEDEDTKEKVEEDEDTKEKVEEDKDIKQKVKEDENTKEKVEEDKDTKEKVEEDEDRKEKVEVDEDTKEKVEEDKDTKEKVKEDENTKEKVEEDKDTKEKMKEDKDKELKEKETATEGKPAGEQKGEANSCMEKDEEKCDEPVQEVSWDEKGMTWEVYGAVVEVAVLGSAIQKHLEKQVKKQKMHASMPPPPPLNPSATPLTSEVAQGVSGSGKGRAGKRGEQDGRVGRRRRNPFRQMMENMQQPHCCSRAHTTE